MLIDTRKPSETAEICSAAIPCKNVKGICTTRNTMTGQHIHRGTNWLVGNQASTSGNKVTKRKLRHSFGTCQGEELADTLNITLKGLSVTSKSATINAIRSSGLRQTITILTTRQTSIMTQVS